MSRTAARILAALAGSAALFSAPAVAGVQAAPVVGEAGAGHGLTVAADGEVQVTFTGRGGVHTKRLYLVRPGQNDLLVFDGQRAAAGDTVSLGAFAAGEAITFRLSVLTPTGANFDLFTGAAALNPMGFANARALSMGARAALVSFEDLRGGGDLSFNDFGFQLDNALAGEVIANPLPGAAWLMLTAMGGVAAWRRRR